MAWPNEPAGLTNVLDTNFNTFPSNMFDVFGNGPASIKTISLGGQQPQSPTSILDYFLPVGATEGGGQFGYDFPSQLGSKVREVYFATWWATNADSQWNQHSANKLFFISGDGNNNVVNWNGPPIGPKQIVFIFQSTNCNSHMGGGCGSPPNNFTSWNLFPNASHNGFVDQGSGWHLLEVYNRASTTANSQNGVIRIWIDGVMSHNYTNLNLSEGGFHSVQYNSTWGGLVCGSPTAVGRDCTKERHHYYDHLRVSVGGGTSSVDRPPGPPAAPTIRTVTVP